MHSIMVFGKIILVEGFFLFVKKKLVTFSYDRWRCTQANLGKYANRNHKMQGEKLKFSFFISLLLIFVWVHSDVDIGR